MDENLSSKRYEPFDIDLESKNSSHSLIVAMTGFNKEILEIGTSTGYLSKILMERGNRVTGIEIDPEAGSIAGNYCDQMIIGDIETLSLDEYLDPVSFDVIICGDVLEHLKNPAIILKKIRKFLKPDGYIVVSLPNFCHGDVLLNLMNGDFHYTSRGLLDETHLHFFGLKNIYSFFSDCGCQIRDLHTTNLDIGNTELKVDDKKIPGDLLTFIRSLPDSSIYQFVFAAFPSDCITIPEERETDLKKLFFESLQESGREFQKPLEAVIDSRDQSIIHLETLLREMTARAETLEGVADARGEQIELLNDSVDSLQTGFTISLEDNKLFKETILKNESRIYDLSALLSDREIHISSLENRLSSIENSIVWQLTMKFHTNIVEKLFPQDTRRRMYYDFLRGRGKTFFFDKSRLKNKSPVIDLNGNEDLTGDSSLTNNNQLNDDFDLKEENADLLIGTILINNKELTDYNVWIRNNEPGTDELCRLKEISGNFAYRPKISIITPVWNTDEKWLRLAIDSVINQVYDNWELCIVDGGSTKKHVKQVLESYAKEDSRIKVEFLGENKGIAANSNAAIALATGEFIGFLDHDDELAPFALYEIVKTINSNSDVRYIYSDEDKIDEQNVRMSPFFKPDWCPDMFLSCNYLCHFSVVKKNLLDKIGGFLQAYDGSQDYDLFLRITEHLKNGEIYHIPKILYHWRLIPESASSSTLAKPYAYIAAKKALADSMARRKIDIDDVLDGCWTGSYRIKYSIHGTPKISIIIPTKDNLEILKQCIQSILAKTTYLNYEIVIIDNQSVNDETLNYYETIRNIKKIKILHYDKPFNFAAMNNYAVSTVSSPYILFLNNDTEVINGDWLTVMLEQAQRENVGAVGAKLLYPDSTIQHAGIILGIIGDPPVGGHAHRHLPDEHHGYCGRAALIQNVSAATAACLFMRKNVFEQAGGFDEQLGIAFNDVDLCMKLRDSGYLLVYTPYARLFHHESFSRGFDDTPEKRQRFIEEVFYIRKKWGNVIDRGDPYYSPNLTRNKEDFSIDPDNRECESAVCSRNEKTGGVDW